MLNRLMVLLCLVLAGVSLLGVGLVTVATVVLTQEGITGHSAGAEVTLALVLILMLYHVVIRTRCLTPLPRDPERMTWPDILIPVAADCYGAVCILLARQVFLSGYGLAEELGFGETAFWCGVSLGTLLGGICLVLTFPILPLALRQVARSSGGKAVASALASVVAAALVVGLGWQVTRVRLDALLLTLRYRPSAAPTFLADEAPQLRKLAALRLIEKQSRAPELVPVLRELLHDPDPALRRLVVGTLLNLGPMAAAARPDLEEVARNDADPEVASRARSALSAVSP
jgi:hypothetical protein